MNNLLESILCLVCIIFVISPPTESAILKSTQWPPKPIEFVFDDIDEDNIRGMGGKDYPIYRSIPRTSFSCGGLLPGFYADQETDCQVFHLCFENRKTSFLCANGTVFSQKLFTCNWWYNTTCSDSPKYFALNSQLYKEKEKPIIEKIKDKLPEDSGNKLNKNVDNKFEVKKLSRLPVLVQSITARNQHNLHPMDKTETTNSKHIKHQPKNTFHESNARQSDEQNSEFESMEEEEEETT